jgi:hypothetical protein
MLASLALIQSLVETARRELVDAALALPQRARSPYAGARRSDDTISDEQRELENWLFDRDSR